MKSKSECFFRPQALLPPTLTTSVEKYKEYIAAYDLYCQTLSLKRQQFWKVTPKQGKDTPAFVPLPPKGANIFQPPSSDRPALKTGMVVPRGQPNATPFPAAQVPPKSKPVIAPKKDAQSSAAKSLAQTRKRARRARQRRARKIRLEAKELQERSRLFRARQECVKAEDGWNRVLTRAEKARSKAMKAAKTVEAAKKTTVTGPRKKPVKPKSAVVPAAPDVGPSAVQPELARGVTSRSDDIRGLRWDPVKNQWGRPV